MTSFELIKKGFVLEARIEFGRVVDDENKIGAIDEPLEDIVEGEWSVDLFANLQDAGYFDHIDLTTTVSSARFS